MGTTEKNLFQDLDKILSAFISTGHNSIVEKENTYSFFENEYNRILSVKGENAALEYLRKVVNDEKNAFRWLNGKTA